MRFVTVANRLIERHGAVNWALLDQALVSGSNVVCGVLLARFLGLEAFGTYSLCWAILVLVSTVHMPLVVGSMMSIGPKQSEREAPAYYGAVILQNLVFSVVAAGTVFVFVELTDPLVPSWNLTGCALPLSIATGAVVWQDFLRRYFYTRSRPGAALALDIARYPGQIAALCLLAFISPDVLSSETALWIVAASAAIPAIAGICTAGAIRFERGSFLPAAVRHYHSGKWLVASAPIEWFGEYFFTFAAGSLLGTAAVGALRGCQNIAAAVSLVFLGLLNVVPPRAARLLYAEGNQAMTDYLRSVTMLGGVATIGIGIAIAAAPEFWLGLLFGEQFEGFGELVRWWVVFYALNFLTLPLRAALRALEHTRPIFVARVLSALIALPSAALLIPWLGLQGAALGLVTAKLVSVLALAAAYRRVRRLETYAASSP